jgi:PST family polysaccharide transporter
MFIDFGFILSATKDCAIARNSPEKLSKILSGVIQAKFILLLVGFIVLFFCCSSFDIFIENKAYLLISYISICFSIFLPDFFFRGIEKMSIITYRVIISRLLYTICIFIFIRGKNDLLFIPISLSISNICAVFLTWYEIIKKMKMRIGLVSIKETLKFLQESSIFFLSRIATSVYSSANTILLGFEFQSTELAQYGAANTLSSSIKGMFSPIADSIYPYMITQKNYNLIKRILLTLMPLIGIGCIGLFIFSEPIVTFICGKDYIDASPIFRLMIPFIVTTLPSYIFGYPVLGSLGKIRSANTSVMIGAAFHIAGLTVLFLTKRISFAMVVLLTGLTEIIVFFIRFTVFIRTNRRI